MSVLLCCLKNYLLNQMLVCLEAFLQRPAFSVVPSPTLISWKAVFIRLMRLPRILEDWCTCDHGCGSVSQCSNDKYSFRQFWIFSWRFFSLSFLSKSTFARNAFALHKVTLHKAVTNSFVTTRFGTTNYSVTYGHAWKVSLTLLLCIPY